MLKESLKVVIPQSVLSPAVAWREKHRLRNVPRKRFLPENLRELTKPALDSAFRDESINATWERDLSRIAAIMPFSDIYGGVCPGERKAIYYLIAFLKPQNVIEIGTHIGASTLCIAQSLVTHVPGGHLVTGDILDVNDPTVGAFQKLGTRSPREGLKALGLQDTVKFRVEPAQRLLQDLPPQMDLIFLDGDHSASAVYEEISLALKRLAPNGLILLHDFYPGATAIYPDGMVVPGPFLAAQRIQEENSDIAVLPLGQLPWETKQGVRNTSLAMVVRQRTSN